MVTGSFKEKENAEKRIQSLNEAGFNSFMEVYEKKFLKIGIFMENGIQWL